jgi:alpha-L-rhamnosidase
MKKLITCIVLIMSFSLLNAQKKSPYNLMVEFIRQPQTVKILDAQPEFSWAVPDISSKQSAYQIIIATNIQKLNEKQADVWNSGKIISNRSAEIEFNNGQLKKNTKYFWKVRIWGIKDKPTEFSPVQEFTTGAFSGYQTTSNKITSELIKPRVFTKLSNSHYFIDFGKDAFGTLVLKISPTQKDSITIHLGEKLSKNKSIDTTPGGSIRYTKIKIAIEPGKKYYQLILPADKRNTGPAAIHLPDSMGVVTPFRYCEIENCHVELKADDVSQKAFWYNWDDTSSSFSSSDTTLNQVWDICKYSIKATSFSGFYIDGDRERIPYEGDAYLNQLAHYCLDNEYSIARKTNEYFIKHPTWPTEWILFTTLMFYNDYIYTGNSESVNNFYKELQYKTLTELARKDGLISSFKVSSDLMSKLGFRDTTLRIKDLIDWPPAQKDTGWKLATAEGERDGYEFKEINTVENCFYYRNLEIMSILSGRLNMKSDSINYHQMAQKVKSVINEKLFDKTKGIYIDGEDSKHSSLHANMFPLALGIVPSENVKSVVSFIKTRGMACSVYGAQFLLEALYNAGEADYALKLLTSTNDRSWWNMIRFGSTITMEAWDMKYKPNSDLNHAWGAAPASMITRGLWGIYPEKPGFAKAIIKPQLSSLKNSKITVPTIRGTIAAEYSVMDNILEYDIKLPANMECDFVLAGNPNAKVLLNNKEVKTDNGKIQLYEINNKIKVIK